MIYSDNESYDFQDARNSNISYYKDSMDPELFQGEATEKLKEALTDVNPDYVSIHGVSYSYEGVRAIGSKKAFEDATQVLITLEYVIDVYSDDDKMFEVMELVDVNSDEIKRKALEARQAEANKAVEDARKALELAEETARKLNNQ